MSSPAAGHGDKPVPSVQPVMTAPEASARDAAAPASPRWYHKLIFVLAIICFVEVGLFLLVFPWTARWSQNGLLTLIPFAKVVWDSPYFRGAVSGVGILNIGIALSEVFRLWRVGQKD